MARKVHVIINPASGQPKPVFHTINSVFRSTGTDWDLSITKESGDAERFARQAAASSPVPPIVAGLRLAYGRTG